MNDGTETAECLTELCWISSQQLTDNYSTYVHAHVQIEPWWVANIREHIQAFVH